MLNERIEAALRRCREMQQEAVAEACRSADPIRREIGRDIAAGRITVREAITSSAYREFFETRFAAIAADQAAGEPEAPPAPKPPAQAVADADDEPFDDQSFVRG